MAEDQIRLRVAQALDSSIGSFYKLKCGKKEEKNPESNDSTDVEMLDSSVVPMVTKWEDFISIVFPLVSVLGPNVAMDPSLALKLLRLSSAFNKCEEWRFRSNFADVQTTMMQIVEKSLVPAVSLMKQEDMRPKYSEELWEVLKSYPYQERYKIYHVWSFELVEECPELNGQVQKTMDELRKSMKRLSKDTVAQVGEKLARVINIFPQPAFDYILDKVQEFQNFIEPVVESMKTLSELSLDVLPYCLLKCLASTERASLKVTDIGLSQWLQSLASFAAQVYARYNLDPTSLLQYVANQMKDGKSHDLILLRELVLVVSGLEAETYLTKENLDVMCGGGCLQKEAGYSSSNKMNRKAVTKLRNSLTETDLLECLCVMVSQQKNHLINKDSLRYFPKLTTHLIDRCHEAFVQFHKFLYFNLKPEEYAKRVPSVGILIEFFNLDIQSAMWLNRSIYMNKMKEIYRLSLESLRSGEPSNDLDQEVQKEKKAALFKTAFDSVIESLQEELICAYPKSCWDHLTSRLYSIFWLLSASDLIVPTAAYERQINTHGNGNGGTVEDRHRVVESDSRRKGHVAKEDLVTDTCGKLRAEMVFQTEHVELVKKALAAERALLSDSTARMVRFLQMCLIPRMILSEVDALYCSKFVELLHQNRTPHFQTIVLFDKALYDVGSILRAITEREAHCYGAFLSNGLGMLMRWRSAKETYDKECEGFPGCSTRVRDPVTGKASDLSYEQYKHIMNKFHGRLTGSLCAVLSTDSSGYVPIRNALTMLVQMLPHFPSHSNSFLAMEKCVKDLKAKAKDGMSDLNLLSTSYLTKLKLRSAEISREKKR